MKSIESLNYRISVDEVFKCLPDLDENQFSNYTQIAITHSENNEDWFDGIGSLYDYNLKKITRNTLDYIILNKYFDNSYIEQLINDVKILANNDKVNIGRIRLMRLLPKTCYTLHQDLEEFRYHIPLITNDKCFFVCGNNIEKMLEKGMLYRFRTNEMHTAVNASFYDRIHLVFDTFRT